MNMLHRKKLAKLDCGKSSRNKNLIFRNGWTKILLQLK